MICMIFVYFYTIYIKRIISEQHEWDTFITLTVLRQVNLPGDIHHPDVDPRWNLPRCSELCNCLKLFPFLLFLPGVFLYSY